MENNRCKPRHDSFWGLICVSFCSSANAFSFPRWSILHHVRNCESKHCMPTKVVVFCTSGNCFGLVGAYLQTECYITNHVSISGKLFCFHCHFSDVRRWTDALWSTGFWTHYSIWSYLELLEALNIYNAIVLGTNSLGYVLDDGQLMLFWDVLATEPTTVVSIFCQPLVKTWCVPTSHAKYCTRYLRI